MTDWTPVHGFRDQLDHLDDQIVALFGQRYALRREVMATKAAHDLPVQDPARIEEVIARAVANARSCGVPEDFARDLYQLVLHHSHLYEERQKNEQPGI